MANSKGTTILAAILVAASCASAMGREPGFAEYRAMQDSLSRVPPRLRSRWLNEHGLELPGYNTPVPTPDRPDSLGLTLRGKWGRGPSWEVTGKDSLVFLSLGSEVAIVNFANPDSPRVLSEVQAKGIVAQAAVRDSFLYIGCISGWSGIEVWNIGDPENPVFRSRTPSMLSDFCIKDTFLYLTQDVSGPNDTFKVYGTSDPQNLHLMGTCQDSGTAISVTGNTALIAGSAAIFAIDVSNPASPHQVGSYPGFALGLAARGSICCASIYWSTDDDHFRFEILDVSDPASMRRLGSIDSCGGYDVFLDGPLAFISGFQTSGCEFQIVSIADSTSPALISSTTTEGTGDGVWEDAGANKAYVADRYRGLAVIDISNLNAPVCDTSVLVADLAYDVDVAGGHCYVADYRAGMRVLNMSNPTLPTEVGGIDSALGTSRAVVVRDSFVFAGWWTPFFRSIDVTNPANPVMAGAANTVNWPTAMVIRDTFVYVAEANRFQVVNVARPRQPAVVGTCNLPNVGVEVLLRDTLAFVSTTPTQVISIADPAAPRAVSTIPTYGHGMAVFDSFAFLPAVFDSLVVYNIAQLSTPVKVAVLRFPEGHQYVNGVALDGTRLFLGGDYVHVVDVSEPLTPRQQASWIPPDWCYRLTYSAPYLYAACYGAGVCILDTVTIGVLETQPGSTVSTEVLLSGSLVRDHLAMKVRNADRKEVMCDVYSVAGARVPAKVSVSFGNGWTSLGLDLRSAPAGVYLLRVRVGNAVWPLRVTRL